MDGEDKGNTKAAASTAQSTINAANATMPGVESNIGSDKAISDVRASSAFQPALSGYTSQQEWGGFDPSNLAQMRGDLAGMQPTGGLDPQALANIRAQSDLWMPSGGYDPEQLAKTLGGYGTMAETGGFSDADKQRFLNQATSGSTATASNLSAAASRAAAAGGGTSGAALANIQRGAGQQQADATTGAMTSLNQQINANKLAGLGGLGTTEGQLSAARQGLLGQRGQFETGVAGLRQGVSGLQQGLESTVAGNRNAANAGLAGLYGTAQGAATAQQQQLLQALGLQYGTSLQGAQIQQELSKNPGLFQTGFSDFVNLLAASPVTKSV